MAQIIFTIRQGASNQIVLSLPADMEASYLRLRAYCESRNEATPEPELNFDRVNLQADDLTKLRRKVQNDPSLTEDDREGLMLWLRRHCVCARDVADGDVERAGRRLLAWGAKVI